MVMGVGDVSGASEAGQSTDVDAERRVGLGLLSRFIGAVFLVLLGGLLLLDRALARANRNQAALDAQSGALLVEMALARDVDFLDRLETLASSEGTEDSLRLHETAARALKDMPAVARAWVTLPDGTRRVDVARDPEAHRPQLEVLVDSVDRSERMQAHPAVNVLPIVRRGGHGALIAMTRSRVSSVPDSGSERARARVGVLIDGDSIRTLLQRTTPGTRTALVLLSGSDTIVRLAGTREPASLVGARQSALVHLPDGGTWTVVATHVLTTRSIRWGMWVSGVAGVLFLAFGLLREQRRALHVAARSVELERLYSDVKRANQAKSEFLANVSHELRTPLNAIVGFVELLRDGFYGDLSPRQVPPVDRIAASATHLRHLVDQVLDIAKIAAGRLEVHTETIVLRPFVLNVASELESLVSEKGLALSITVGASLPRVRTDPTHLRQILINLIGNAVKYTPSGSVSVRARLLGAPEELGARTPTPRAGMDDPSAAALLARAPRSGIWVALQVIDTGVGIAASDLTRIFDEFEQVNAGPRGDSMQRGTGLGLAISRRLARLLGGDISVESVLGRGSTFTIWLPVSPSDLTRERRLSGEVQSVPTA
jgi:signal transduction histidine kinase